MGFRVHPRHGHWHTGSMMGVITYVVLDLHGMNEQSDSFCFLMLHFATAVMFIQIAVVMFSYFYRVPHWLRMFASSLTRDGVLVLPALGADASWPGASVSG